MKKIKLILLLLIIVLLVGCGEKKEKFIVTESGKKQYKNDDGILVKNDWVEVDGDKYYFDLNGYMVTNDWIQNEYYVDKDGKMKTDFWYNDEKNPEVYYYLGDDGKYVKNDIIEIAKKKYAFDKDGKWVKNKTYEVEKPDKYVAIDANGIVIEKEGICEVDGKKYYVKDDGYILIDGWKDIDNKKAYFDSNGKRIYKGFGILERIISTESEIKKWCYIDENGDILKDDYIKVDNFYYCANKDGVLLQNEWDEYEGKKYYYGPDCYMLTNQLVDNVYYVDNEGAMVTNKDVMIDGKTYTFGSDGKGDIKIVKKISNEYWEIKKYTDTGKKYVVNRKEFVTSSNEEIILIVDKDDVRMRMYWKSNGRVITMTEDYVHVTVDVNDNRIINFQTVKWDEDGYIIFNNTQKNIILNAMQNENNKLYIIITESSSTKTYTYGAVINATGFNEIYSSLF